MTFAAPTWLLLLGLIPVVVLLHNRKRTRVEVGSLVIWRRLIDSGEASGGRQQRPSWNLPLLLQLLALILLVLALARPQLESPSIADHHLYFIDASTTMAITETGSSRFDEALTRLQADLARLPEGSLASVVRVGPWPELLVARKPTGSYMTRELAQLEGSDGPADWPAAVEQAMPLLSRGASHVTILSDDYGLAAAHTALADRMPTAQVTAVSFGSLIENIGFGTASIVSEDSAGRWRVDGSLMITGSTAKTVGVEVLFEPAGTTGALPWAATEVALADTSEVPFSIPLELPGPGLVILRLTTSDGLQRDDRVVLEVTPDAGTIRVLRVGESNAALERALLLMPGVELHTAMALPVDTDAFDLVIINGVSLNEVPATSTVWINTAPPGLATNGVLSQPVPTIWDTEHPLSRGGVDWTAFDITSALILPQLSGARILLEADGAPLIQARTATAGRQVIIAFALEDSTWTAQLGFPLFVAGLLDWAVPDQDLSAGVVCHAGSVCGLPRLAFSNDWRLLDPAGEPVASSWPSGTHYDSEPAGDWWPEGVFDNWFRPELAGTYVLEVSDQRILLPVLPAAPRQPLDTPTLLPMEHTSSLADSSRDPWRWLVLAALAVILMEVLLGLQQKRFQAIRTLRRSVRRWRPGVIITLSSLAIGSTLAAALSVRVPWPSRPASDILILDTQSGLDTLVTQDYSLILQVKSYAGFQTVPAGDGAESGESQAVLATDSLEQALEIALASSHGAARSRITISSGPHSTLSASALAKITKQMPTRLDDVIIVKPPLDEQKALGIEQISIPAGLRAGDAFDLVLTVRTAIEQGTILRLKQNGRLIHESERQLTPGDNLISLPVTAGEAGPHRFQVEIASTSTSLPIAEETAFTSIANAARAVIFTTDATAGSIMAAALSEQGLEAEVRLPINMPWTSDDWKQHDVAILMNLPAIELHSMQQDLLEEWVRDEGGGLLLLGGENSFGPGGYFQTSLERLSPLSSRVPHEAPEVTIIFVLDRSGSMQQVVGSVTRMDIAKEATISAIELLGNESLVGVVVFDSEAEVLVPVQPVMQEDLADTIRSVRANGGTKLYEALVEAYGMLDQVDSSAVHVIVMTDGLSQPGDFAGILGDLRAFGATTSMVGIGSNADRNQLLELARLGGGAFHLTVDERALPAILAQEAMMSSAKLIEEGPAFPQRVSDAAFLEGLGPLSVPLEGYVLTTAKPHASVHLILPDNDSAPLLASWRYGLGRVVAFTSHGVGSWATAWMDLEEYPRLWSQIVRWTTPNLAQPGLNVSLKRSGLNLEISASLQDIASTATSNARLGAELFATDGSGTRWQRLTATTPGYYTGNIRLGGPGIYRLRILADGQDAEAFEQELVVPESSSHLGSIELDTSLQSLITASGGSVVTDLTALSRMEAPIVWSRSAPPWFWLIVAITSFLAALLVRYAPNNLLILMLPSTPGLPVRSTPR